MTQCPRCNIELVALGASPGARCPNCRGVWVPGSTLEASGASAGVASLLTGFAASARDEPALRCPACRSETLQALGKSRFRIDRCPGCGGVWIEGTLLDQMRTEITPRWQGFLGTLLGPGLAEVIRYLVDESAVEKPTSA